MVILITGASYCGKTYLAQKMLEKYNYPYISIDHLKMGLIRSGQTDLTVEDDESLTYYLWPIVSEIIKTAIENDQNLIMEGCYVPFNWRRSFDENYLGSIHFICLAFSDSYIDLHYNEIKKHACIIESRQDDFPYTKEDLKEMNQEYIEGCRDNFEQVTLIDSDFEKTIKGLLK